MATATQIESRPLPSLQNVLRGREPDQIFWTVYGLPCASSAVIRVCIGLASAYRVDAPRLLFVRAGLCPTNPGDHAEDSSKRRFNSLLRKLVLCANVLLMCLFSGTASAADLRKETLKAWDDYVAAANTQMQQRMSSAHPFLLADGEPGHTAKLRNGEILVFPAGQHIPKRVPSGLIHDWYGQIFIPNMTLLDVRRVLRNYECYKEMYKPVVVDSRSITSSESQDQFYVLLVNKSLVPKTALDIDFRSSYFRVDDRRGYKISESTRIQKIAGYGTDHQRMLPPDQGTGLMWRAYDITRFEERDGGVYIEVEEIVLSRDIPVSIRWIVDPIIRRVSRGSVTTSLRQIRDAARWRPGAESSPRNVGSALPVPHPLVQLRLASPVILSLAANICRHQAIGGDCGEEPHCGDCNGRNGSGSRPGLFVFPRPCVLGMLTTFEEHVGRRDPL